MKQVNFPDELESPNDKFFTHAVVDWFLQNAGNKSEFDWTELTLGATAKEKCEALNNKFIEITNLVTSKGGKGFFWIIVHPRMFDFLSNWSTKLVSPMIDQFPLGFDNIIFMGILDKRWRIYTDNLLDPNNMLMGAGFSKKHNNYYCNIKANNFYNPNAKIESLDAQAT